MISFAQSTNRLVGLVIDRDARTSAPERNAFVEAMAGAVNGVGIVTTDGRAGRWGLTVSSIASVSADPPLLLVSINRRSPVVDAIQGNGSFGVNLLSPAQRPLADNFAGLAAEGPPFDFELADWVEGAYRAPMLEGATASFGCRVRGAVDAGSHTVFFGRVVEVRSSRGPSLLYTRRSYGVAGDLNETHRHNGARRPDATRRTKEALP